ncbi:hypothetical protein BB558_001178 [Smittium angustum]|uniref:SET domain-containing protein n=1 Tax=Smittium angustum TaxID=133377 RepID=A0A2U1JCJ4_SMIAN|nr:hypothetical protein BB558_001178 [Smittium angustum]
MAPISVQKILENLLEWFESNNIKYNNEKIKVVVNKIGENNNNQMREYVNPKEGVSGGSKPFIKKSSPYKPSEHLKHDFDGLKENQEIQTKNINDTVLDGFGVISIDKINEEDILVTIPKSALISSKTSPLTNIFEEESIAGEFALTVAVMFELSSGKNSPFWGYLQSLPYCVDVPLLWTKEEQNYLIGTDAYMLIVKDKERLKTSFEVLNLLTKKYPYIFANNPGNIEWNSFEEYLRVNSLVTSRSFKVDDFRGDCMVPFADLFNHKSGAEDVHVYCDPEVCTACGELYGCEHNTLDNLADTDNKDHQKEFNMADDDSSSDGSGFNENIGNDGSEYSDVNSDEDSDEDTFGGEEIPVLLNIKKTAPETETNVDHNNSAIDETNPEAISNIKPKSDLIKNVDEISNDEDNLEIIAIKSIKKNFEVFNTYGMHSSGHFLHRYGFFDSENIKHEIVHTNMLNMKNIAQSSLKIEKEFEMATKIFISYSKHFEVLSKCQQELDEGDFTYLKDILSETPCIQVPSTLENSEEFLYLDNYGVELFFNNTGHPNYSLLVYISLISTDLSVLEYLNKQDESDSLVSHQILRLSIFWALWCYYVEENIKNKHFDMAKNRSGMLNSNKILLDIPSDAISFSRWLQSACVHKSEKNILGKTIKKYQKLVDSLE